jgi:hypothetical protein
MRQKNDTLIHNSKIYLITIFSLSLLWMPKAFSIVGFDFIRTSAFNFQPQGSNDVGGVTPSCLHSAGIDLIVFDPGHDDTEASQRSDAKIRGGNGKYVFQWPDVHEGKLNMIASYLAYEYLVGHPKLTTQQRAELKTMIRLSRYPGEKYFGQYESETGYGPKGGIITDEVDNRKSRINTMMSNHRPYDSATGLASKTKKVNVNRKTLMISVHANSTDYFDEGDLTWIIPPKSPELPSVMNSLLLSFRDAFASKMGDYVELQDNDSDLIKKLKSGAQNSVKTNNVRTNAHSLNLAMLSSTISTPHKILIEGFVMNGKMGHLAYADIKNNPNKKRLEFRKGSNLVASYDVADLYMAYARSIAQGIQEKYDCK